MHRHYALKLDGKTVGIMTVVPLLDNDLDDNFYELQGLYLHPIITIRILVHKQ